MSESPTTRRTRDGSLENDNWGTPKDLYDRVDKPKFIQKAFEEWRKGNTCVLLIPMGYAVGCMPIQAASVGAPQFRDRIYFVADSTGERRQRNGSSRIEKPHPQIQERLSGRDSSAQRKSHWQTESEMGRLVDGFPSRMDANWCGPIHGFGNAIVPQVAQAFIEAFMECRP